MQVHGCLDHNLVRINTIKKGKRETFNKATTGVCLNDWPLLGIPADILNCGFNPCEEVHTKSRRLKFIVLRCIKHLRFSRAKKNYRLHQIAALASLRTSSALRAEILPSLYA